MVLIRILDGPQSGQSSDLSPGTHTVGRGKGADIALGSEAVSGKHLELTVADDGVILFKDLQSTNGTFVGGAKVESGEWFPNTEIRLGDVRLLNDAQDAGAADEGNEERRAEARAEVLAGGRKSKPLLAILAICVLVTAGGLFWFLQEGSDDEVVGIRRPAAAGGLTTGPVDLLEGLGRFGGGAAEAWDIGDGLVAEGEVLSNGGNRVRALLARRFTVPAGALVFRAQVKGLNVWPLLEWGREGEDRAIASWMGSDLGEGPSRIALPAEAVWYRLAIIVEGVGTLADLEAEEGDGEVSSFDHEGRKLLVEGGNLILRHRDGRALLHAQSSGGTWAPVEGGLTWKSTNTVPVTLWAGEALRETGTVQLLAEGGPVSTSPGVAVASAPGLILGGEARRMMVRSSHAMNAVCGSDGGIALNGSSELFLKWELTFALQEAARLAREIERSARESDDKTLLDRTSELLRDWPLDEAKVARALELSALAIGTGRAELGLIQDAVGEALFLDSVADMNALANQAAALAERLPGTGIDEEALAAENLLRLRAQELLDAKSAAESAYRSRLVDALASAYPIVAAWLEGAK